MRRRRRGGGLLSPLWRPTTPKNERGTRHMFVPSLHLYELYCTTRRQVLDEVGRAPAALCSFSHLYGGFCCVCAQCVCVCEYRMDGSSKRVEEEEFSWFSPSVALARSLLHSIPPSVPLLLLYYHHHPSPRRRRRRLRICATVV